MKIGQQFKTVCIIILLLLCGLELFRSDSVAADAPTSGLEGTAWFADRGVPAKTAEEQRWTLEFQTNGQVEGRAGCNRFFGTFEIKDKSLSFGNLKANKMLCKPALMEKETQYLATLQSSTSFQIQDGALLIFGTAIEPILRLSEMNRTLDSEPTISAPAAAALPVNAKPSVESADAKLTTSIEPTPAPELPAPVAKSWYLMLPPLSGNAGEDQRVASVSAPIATWDIEKTFDTDSACAALMRSERMLSRSTASPDYVAQHAQAKCVASDEVPPKASISESDQNDSEEAE
jgi:heat shock protein HslJ